MFDLRLRDKFVAAPTKWAVVFLLMLLSAGPISVLAKAQTQTIQVNAVNADGTNTGTARLGAAVNMTAVISSGPYSVVNWTLQGAGKLVPQTNTTATYTPPSTMPSNTRVTITGYFKSAPSVSATYALTVINATPSNPVPAISSSSVAQIQPGATTSVTLTGSNFIAGTTVLVNGSQVSSTYQSATSLVAQIPVAAGATGSVSVQAQNPAPGGGTSTAFALPIWYVQMTATSSDGTNTGTARLGVPISLSATAYAGSNHYLSWTLTGPGTLNTGGTYTGTASYIPPQSMPSDASVTITVALSASSATATSYNLTLINPNPTVSTVTPASLQTAGTQSMWVQGAGFVPGTTVIYNGNAVSTTFNDYNHVVAQVPVPANATGSLSMQVQNPTPGGGTSAGFSEPVAATTIALSAATSGGASTSSTGLSGSLQLTAAVSGTMQPAVTWSVSAGTINSYGYYTAPATMPSGNVVNITATLTSNPAVTATFALSLLNPVPTITGFNPSQIPAGTTTAVTISGSGFVPGTVFMTDTGSVTATYSSPTSMSAQLTLPATASGNVTLQAQNSTPGGGTSSGFQGQISTLAVSSVTPDGTNTGTVRLGVPSTLTATFTNSQYSVVSWTLQGAGKLVPTSNTGATYTPPQTMPSNSSVTITASSSNAGFATSYTFTLVNPIPAVSSGGATPTQLQTGSTQTVTLAGSGFVPGTYVQFNGSSLPTSYIDYNDATVQVPVATNASGNLSLQVVNPGPGAVPARSSPKRWRPTALP